MTTHLIAIGLPLFVFYLAFWFWYGGNGSPMSQEEINEALDKLRATDASDHAANHTEQSIADVRRLMLADDGKEFVMMNLVRYRAKALYPPGYSFSDNPRAADKRYGKSIIGSLLRYGNMILFIAPRTSDFIVPENADEWDYVAMVRYRSRRDFLRFAIDSNQAEKFVHKWAAIEKTHVFAVKPIVSLFALRTLVALFLVVLGTVLQAAL